MYGVVTGQDFDLGVTEKYYDCSSFGIWLSLVTIVPTLMPETVLCYYFAFVIHALS
jgi:hypothetical protein